MHQPQFWWNFSMFSGETGGCWGSVASSTDIRAGVGFQNINFQGVDTKKKSSAWSAAKFWKKWISSKVRKHQNPSTLPVFWGQDTSSWSDCTQRRWEPTEVEAMKMEGDGSSGDERFHSRFSLEMIWYNIRYIDRPSGKNRKEFQDQFDLTGSCPRITVLVALGPSQLSKNYESLPGGYRHKTSDQLLGRAEAHSEEAGANFSTKNNKSPTAPLKIGPKYDSSVWVQLFKYSWGRERMNVSLKQSLTTLPAKKEFKTSQTLRAYLIFSKSAEGCVQRSLRSRRSGSWSRPWRFGSFFSMEGTRFLVDENDRIVNSSMAFSPKRS